mmetsp:Transcript_44989/g.141625  ORF Transcript_44989/g.141625 Transcript_44989/m.141625 type:complete len:187 (+) Transcript_44989:232-792(+)
MTPSLMPSQRLLQHSSRSFKGSFALKKDNVWNLHAIFILWLGYIGEMLRSIWTTHRAASAHACQAEEKRWQRQNSLRRKSESMKDDYQQLLQIMQDCCQSGHVVLTSPPSKLDSRRRREQQTHRRKSMTLLECKQQVDTRRSRLEANTHAAWNSQQGYMVAGSPAPQTFEKLKRRNDRILSKWVEM